MAAARALAARMRELWPAAEVLELEGTGRGGWWRDVLLRVSYDLTLRFVPQLYGLGYDLLVRFPKVAELFKAMSAGGIGRSLEPALTAAAPDLVVSTYPMISGGLAWLRRRGRLPGRAVAVVTDVAVHPFWVWPELDETWTLLPASREQAKAVAPGAGRPVGPRGGRPALPSGRPGRGPGGHRAATRRVRGVGHRRVAGLRRPRDGGRRCAGRWRGRAGSGAVRPQRAAACAPARPRTPGRPVGCARLDGPGGRADNRGRSGGHHRGRSDRHRGARGRAGPCCSPRPSRGTAGRAPR